MEKKTTEGSKPTAAGTTAATKLDDNVNPLLNNGITNRDVTYL